MLSEANLYKFLDTIGFISNIIILFHFLLKTKNTVLRMNFCPNVYIEMLYVANNSFFNVSHIRCCRKVFIFCIHNRID